MNKLSLEFFIFEDQIEPKGFLTRDKGCHALWYYFVRATANRAQVGRGPESQTIIVPAGDDSAALWMDHRYESIARAVAMQYGFNDPGGFWNYWPAVEAEAARLGIVVHSDVRGVAPGKGLIN